MGSCIYKLNFNNTDKVYIGQALNFNRRIGAHRTKLRKGMGAYKLQEAYNLYGEPIAEVLEECDAEVLCSREDYYIEKYNSIDNGFNACTSAGQRFFACGEKNKLSKYTDIQYISVFEDLVHTDDSIPEISSRYNVSIDVVRHISIGRAHIWLQTAFPTEYAILLEKVGKRYRKNPLEKRLLVSPEGEVFEVESTLKEFARIHDIGGHAHLGDVLNGKRKSYKKWTKYTESESLT